MGAQAAPRPTAEPILIDAMKRARQSIAENWRIDFRVTGHMKISARIRLDRSGRVVGEPEFSTRGGLQSEQARLSAAFYRAIMKSQPFDYMPRDNYEAWKEITLGLEIESGP